MQSVLYDFIKILALLFLLLPQGCVRDVSDVIDSKGSLPLLHSVFVVPDTLNSDTLIVKTIRSSDDTLTTKIFLCAKAYIANSNEKIQTVRYRIQNDIDGSIFGEGMLFDDGKNGDKQTNDSLYSSYVPLTFRRALVGKFWIQIWSTTSYGYSSATQIKPFYIVRNNHAPVISDLVMPDTVDTYQMKSFKIMLKVYDADGNDDILFVYRITQAGNKYQLNDQGLNGDIVAGNGVYTETIAWSDPTAPKSDIYKFIAIDRSLDTSNVIIHPIIVKSQ